MTNDFYGTNLNYSLYQENIKSLYREWTNKDINRHDMRLINTIYCGVKYKDKVVACAMLNWNDDPVWYRRWAICENVYVLKEFRRQGVGTLLMKTVAEAAEYMGCEFIKLTSSKEEGIALYRSLGWKEGLSFRKDFNIEERKRKKIKVAIAGGFDPLHKGHLHHIKKARELGDTLIVILGTDEMLINKKGYAFMNLENRLQIVSSIKGVDEVVIAVDTDGSCAETLRELKPDIFAKGGDRTPDNMNLKEIEVCQNIGCKIIYGVGDLLDSSSTIVRRSMLAREKVH